MLTTWEDHADTSFSVWMMKHIRRKHGTLNSEVKITVLQWNIETPLFFNVSNT